MTNSVGLHPLHEQPDRFRACVRYTAANAGFNERLIEKDYFCSLLLKFLAPLGARGLVFKGGTALSKVHANFFRLSEDLDFTIAMPADAGKSARRRAMEPIKTHLVVPIAGLNLSGGIHGANVSSHYTATFEYRSCLADERATIKFEVSLREPILESTATADAQTLLLDPLTGGMAVAPIPVTVLSRGEAYAEKVRAALSRTPAAIRDFFDIDHAVQSQTLNLEEAAFQELVRRKLEILSPKSTPNVSLGRRAELQRQLQSDLRPVLRERDIDRFDLNRIFDSLARLACAIA